VSDIEGKLSYLATEVDGTVHHRQLASIHCPACGYAHTMGIGPHARGPVWSFNGDSHKPVFGPSLLTQRYMWHPPVTPENLAQWREAPWPQEQRSYVCHSFIGCNGAQPGQIIFLGDCTHALAGQVVDLPDFPRGA
jgi:hypothetical protein